VKTSDDITPLRVACPWCNAQPNEPCLYPDGHPCRPHAIRRKAAIDP
jgi:hypothetical protein